jgi:hypothetical protein
MCGNLAAGVAAHTQLVPCASLGCRARGRTKQPCPQQATHPKPSVITRSLCRRALDEVHAGTFDGMTYKEIEEVAPEEFARRSDDKLTYR